MGNDDTQPPLQTPQDGLYRGSMRPFDGAQSFNALNAAIRRMLSMMGADTIVEVTAVNASGQSPVGSVDVRPLVSQQTGDGLATPHAEIFNVPYLRMQGGKTAVILDPQVGDIGAVIICGRDISRVKETRAAAHPGSFRMHDMSDAIYVGGLLNAAPQHFIRLAGGQIDVAAEAVTVAAPVTIKPTLTVEDQVSMKSSLEVQGQTVLKDDLNIAGYVQTKGDVQIKGSLSVGAGASGGFTTMNGHMITVQNGIVVAIG